MLLAMWLAGCLAVANYDYSLSADFPNGIVVVEFESHIEKGDLYNATLVGVTVTGDVVNIQFQNSLLPVQDTVLNFLVKSYSTISLLNRFCADLPDASINLTEEMVSLGVLVTNCTASRTYTLMTATDMVASRKYIGKFVLVNNGVASATIGMGTGGTTPNNMVVLASTAAQFVYTVTNDITGSHAYLVLRTS